MTLQHAQRYLSGVWLAGFGILAIVMYSQGVVADIYGEYSDRMWSWFKTTTLPTVTLMFGAIVTNVVSNSSSKVQTDRFLFWTALLLSIVYLVALLGICALVGVRMSFSPVESSKQFIEIFQALIMIVIGAFFVRSQG